MIILLTYKIVSWLVAENMRSGGYIGAEEFVLSCWENPSGKHAFKKICRCQREEVFLWKCQDKEELDKTGCQGWYRHRHSFNIMK